MKRIDRKKKTAALFLCLAFLLTACAQTQTATEPEAETQTQDSPSGNTEISVDPENLQIPDEEAGDPSDLYKDIVDLYYQALYERQTYPEDRNTELYDTESPLVSSIINPYWSWENADDILSKVGFALLDLNEDGLDELVIGWSGNEFWNLESGYLFAVYTMVNGESTLAIEGWERCLYVIGQDGYIYQNGSGGAWDSTFTKYRFNPEYEGFLEPIEKLYSCGDPGVDYWWEHITNPEDIGAIEYTEKHEDLIIDQDEALAAGQAWMESGAVIHYTLFSEYR